MGGSEPRKHHIIPAFYLAGFTMTDSQTGMLRIFDQREANRYKSIPKRACRQTDFFRVDEPGVDPNTMEKLLSWHEGEVAPFIREIGSGRVEHKRTVGEALSLAAVIVVRNRRGRRIIQDNARATIAKKLRSGEIAPDQWESLRASELRHGATPDEVPDYGDARDRLLKGEWFPRGPIAPAIGIIPELQEWLMKTLHQQHWELHITDSTTNGGFITSDSPVALGQLEALSGRDYVFRNPFEEITFPVSRNAALVSYPGARDSSCEATDAIVAHVNTRTMYYSDRLIFHAQDDFILEDPEKNIRKGSEGMKLIAEAKRRGFRLGL